MTEIINCTHKLCSEINSTFQTTNAMQISKTDSSTLIAADISRPCLHQHSC